MGKQLGSVIRVLACAGILCAGFVPAGAQMALREQASATTEEFIVNGTEAAFIGSDPVSMDAASAVRQEIVRPSAEDLSGLLPVPPDDKPSMKLPDSDVDSLILPPSSDSVMVPPASSPVPPWPFDKSEGIESRLIRDAEIVSTDSEDDRNKSRAEIIGRLVIEEQPVSRRKMLRRWVLKTEAGDRIPLTSNYQLLSSVKKPGIPDEPIKITGRWISSPTEPRLKYFTGDRFEVASASGTVSVTASSSVSAAEPVPDAFPASFTTEIPTSNTVPASDTGSSAVRLPNVRQTFPGASAIGTPTRLIPDMGSSNEATPAMSTASVRVPGAASPAARTPAR